MSKNTLTHKNNHSNGDKENHRSLPDPGDRPAIGSHLYRLVVIFITFSLSRFLVDADAGLLQPLKLPG